MITNIIVYINSRNIIKAKQMAMISTTNLRRQGLWEAIEKMSNIQM